MTFYIKPPQGTVSLYKLYEEAEVRLQYLVQVCNSSIEKVVETSLLWYMYWPISILSVNKIYNCK